VKRVLLTGATGFLGRRVVPLLVDAGYEVHVVARTPARGENVHAHAANLLRQDEQRELLRRVRPTHMVHLAWHTPPGQFWTAEENRAWLASSVELLRNFAGAGGKRWVGAGTCAEYDWSRGGRFREADPCRPHTLYGECKNALRAASAELGQELGIEVAWGRIFYPYGPGEPDARLVPSVIRALLAGQAAPCTEGKQVRDYVYVDDVARAFVLLLQSEFKGPVNIASGEGVSVRRVVTAVAELVGRPELVQFGALPARDFEPAEVTADVTTLRSLGFEIGVGLREGLRRAVETIKNQR
jgi:nucleoside-diphosphate-sugar epimerase